MTDSRTRPLSETDWQIFRDLRLEALRESPDSFVASHDEESQYDEQTWRERIRNARWFVAERQGEPVGIAGLEAFEQDDEASEVFGLWVVPQERGSRVAWKLVQAAAEQAAADERKRLYFWVGSDNGAAVAFASAFGFRPTSERRTVGVDDRGEDEQEAAMVLSLGPDPSSVANPWFS